MPHPEIDNQMPFEMALSMAMDQEGRTRLIVISRAVFAISRRGQLGLLPEQPEIELAGEARGDGAESSYKYEPIAGWKKPGTDVVLIGHAWPKKPKETQVDVLFRVGSVQQVARIYGERAWYRTLGSYNMTKPLPFDAIPLTWEYAYGGRDQDAFEPRNPIGKGFYKKGRPFEENLRLPNIEHPRFPIKSLHDTPPPVGFGFTQAHWEPRRQYAGTCDAKWEASVSPRLPADFDLRFFNAAPPELINTTRFRGGERIQVVNGTRRHVLEFSLPRVPPPTFRFEVRGREDKNSQGDLDTIVVNVDDGLLLMDWRASIPIRDPHEVETIEARLEGYQPPEPIEPHPDVKAA